MSRLNPAYLKYKINTAFEPSQFRSLEKSKAKLENLWRKLNQTNFYAEKEREKLIDLINPAIDPYSANYVITSLRQINQLTNLNQLVRLDNYQGSSHPIVKEIALHRVAHSENPLPITNTIAEFFYGDSAEMEALRSALLKNQYHKNPAWLNQIHVFTRSLLIETVKRLCSLYLKTPAERRLWIETALVAAAVVESQKTYDLIFNVLNQTSGKMADRIKEDREKFLGKQYAYLYTPQVHLASIAEKGLSIQFAPAGCEQPEALCFSNAHYAGVDHILLGISGYYVKEALLRVRLEDAPFRGGYRTPYEDLGDFTADYLLDKQHIIPPEKIKIVDPRIATRAIPLVIK